MCSGNTSVSDSRFELVMLLMHCTSRQHIHGCLLICKVCEGKRVLTDKVMAELCAGIESPKITLYYEYVSAIRDSDQDFMQCDS